MDTDSQWLLLIFCIVLIVYFIPVIIAKANSSNRMTGIFWLNLLTGWSVIGWITALIWAITSNRENRHVIVGTISTPSSVADELGKLKKLQEDGIISSDDFETHKNSLLLRRE